jgi:hypothetical protein
MTEDTMTEQATPTGPGDDDLAPGRAADASDTGNDTEGHRRVSSADGQQAEGSDTEGHRMSRADAEQAEGEDTEAHVYIEESRNDGLSPD